MVVAPSVAVWPLRGAAAARTWGAAAAARGVAAGAAEPRGSMTMPTLNWLVVAPHNISGGGLIVATLEAMATAARVANMIQFRRFSLGI